MRKSEIIMALLCGWGIHHISRPLHQHYKEPWEEEIDLKWVITKLKRVEEFLKVKTIIARIEDTQELKELLMKIRDVRKCLEALVKKE